MHAVCCFGWPSESKRQKQKSPRTPIRRSSRVRQTTNGQLMSDLSAKVPLTFERRVSSGGGGVFLLVIGGGSIAVMLIAVLSDSYFYRDPVWRGWFMAGLVLVIGGAICLHFYPFREWTEKVVVGGGWVRRYK